MHLFDILSLAIVLASGVSASLLPPSQWYSGYQQMLDQVNAQRKLANKAPLCTSPKLMTSANTHSQYQADRNLMTHDENGESFITRFNRVGISGWAYAENVAQTWDFNVTLVMGLWMNSSGHRANILGDAYTHFGSSAIKAASGKVYWTQQFVKAAAANEPCYVAKAVQDADSPAQLINPVAMMKKSKGSLGIKQMAANLLKKISHKKE